MSKLKYIPILRVRQEEVKVLKSFDFGDRIYPCIEIIKEIDRLPPTKTKAKKSSTPKKVKQFEDTYIPLIKNINAERVFVDLPIHLKSSRGMKVETIKFLQSVVSKRERRTEYIKKLTPIASKVIPVISSYFSITGEKGSITLQEKDLRPDFHVLAFRVFMKTFFQDVNQIEPILRNTDFIIMDWDDTELDLTDGDQYDIVEYLKKLKCSIIIHRCPFPKDITNVGLDHGNVVDSIDNSLLNKYKSFGGNCFSDYVGIKKDNISDGGITSPGFIYYDAVNNEFYGYRYKDGGHRKGEKKPDLKEFESRIIPAVISSDVSLRMQKHILDYLGKSNVGWEIINNINKGSESGKSAAKFKRISMEHYLHCLKMRISNGDFD